MKRTWIGLIIAVAGTAAVCGVAGGADEPVRVSVTAVSGRSIFLDRGSKAGLAPGQPVRLFLPDGTTVEGIIADVSASSARVEMPSGVPSPPVGTSGEADVPEPPAPAPPEPEQPRRAVPAHPPWTRREGPHDPETPLLAPAFSRPPSERASTIHGNIFSHLQYSWDHGQGRDNRYLLARLGGSLEMTNPFGQGGRLRLDGEINRRDATVFDGDDDSKNQFLLHQFSYALGGEHYAPYRLELGRFRSYYLPALGTIDGAEGALQFDSGLSIGAGAGSYVRPSPEEDFASDLGFHLFVDYAHPRDRSFTGTLGYQKTWHDGAADRDAIFGRFTFTPNDHWWLYGSLTADIYGSGDTIKSGPQLTEAWLQARYTPDRTKGVGLSYARYTWPELKRWEFQFAPVELIRDGRVDRVELSGWHEIVKDVRLTGRVNAYADQRGDGKGAQLDLDWHQPGGLAGSLHADIFYTDAAFLTGQGLRLEVRPGTGDLYGFAGYELFRYTTSGSIGGDESLIRHTVRAGVGFHAGRWFYNLTADHYFGDAEDAYSLGAFITFRF